MKRILVIRLGALGDIIFCLNSFQNIRAHHPEAKITLLTTAPFADFSRKMPYFDQVLIDARPSFLDARKWLHLRRDIKFFNPELIYDLQGKKRQTILYALLGGPFGPTWSGAAPFCALPRVWPPTPSMSFGDFLNAQLGAAHVPQTPTLDLTWLNAEIERFSLPGQYVVMIPGSSPQTPYKRWPAMSYAHLARCFDQQHIKVVCVGSDNDRDLISQIKNEVPTIIDLSGKTTLFELAGIFRAATGVIGNDTGPTHMSAILGTPTLALFSAQSSPTWSKPPGRMSSVLLSETLFKLGVDEVMARFKVLLQNAKNKG